MKKLLSLLLTALLLLSFALPAFALNIRVTDHAELFSAPELSAVEDALAKASGETGYETLLLTEDFYDTGDSWDTVGSFLSSLTSDGIVLYVNMDPDTREWIIRCNGEVQELLSDNDTDYIGACAQSYLSSGRYVDAVEAYAEAFAEKVEEIKAYNSLTPEEKKDLQAERSREKAVSSIGKYVLIGLVIGLIVALIATGSMKRKLKTVAFKREADPYLVPGSMVLTNQTDLFLYSTITRTARPKDTNRSSGHSYSGGGHSGGSRGHF